MHTSTSNDSLCPPGRHVLSVKMGTCNELGVRQDNMANLGAGYAPYRRCRRACLVQGHLHGEALIVYVGDCWAIHIEQDKAAVVSDDAAPLVVNLLQVLSAQPAIAVSLCHS